MKDLKAGIYQHYTGLMVLVLGLARHSETEEKLVAYVPLGVAAKPRIVVRPHDMFFEQVEIKGGRKPRFEYIGAEIDDELAAKYDKLSGFKGMDRLDSQC